MRTMHACVLVLGLLSVTAAQKLFFRPLAKTNQHQKEKVKPVIYNSEQAVQVDVVCPGGKRECDAGSTCCMGTYKVYYCCAYHNAVCCSDGIHCCPFGSKCNLAKKHCERGDVTTSWDARTPTMANDSNIGKTVPVPDQRTANQTTNQNGSLSIEKQPSHKIKADSVKCDSRSICPDGHTCCKLSSGQWGCCPVPNAVCCSDGTHCCPTGTTCDASSGRCSLGDTHTDWFEKQPVLKTKEDSVKCDHEHECPTGNTCCKLAGGQWGCCPLPNAVCCQDGSHCCPSGTKCDSTPGKCYRADTHIDWFKKQPVLKIKATVDQLN